MRHIALYMKHCALYKHCASLCDQNVGSPLSIKRNGSMGLFMGMHIIKRIDTCTNLLQEDNFSISTCKARPLDQ